MTEVTTGLQEWLKRWATTPFAYLTTTGRKTGQPHRIEIWFAVEGGRLYMMAGGRDRSDWVRNLRATPQIAIELGDETRTGTARILQDGTVEDRLARDLLVEKYARPEDLLVDWKRRSLAVVVEFPDAADRTAAPHS